MRSFRSFSPRSLVALFALLPCAAACSADAVREETAATEDPLLVAPAGVWSRSIEVCWDIETAQLDAPGSTTFAQRRARVRAAVDGSWSRASRVRTTGWGNCPRKAPFGDRILISTRPGGARASIGKSGNNWIGLDLNDGVLEAAAIHEFGHALGFYHEQADPRTPSTCTENEGDLRANPGGSIAVSDWDPLSIMNYCNDNWVNGRLSPTDMAGVARFYGQRPHDATGDKREDILLAPAAGWTEPALGAALAGGGFALQQRSAAGLYTYVSQGGQMLAGDFDGDGLQDFALVRGNAGWSSIPVYFNKGDGTYRATNEYVVNFPEWSRTANVTAVVGDFNADGRADIALAGGATWGSTPIALSRGDGKFDVINPGAGDFAVFARQPGAKLLAGDFDGDGYSDLALTGGTSWRTIPVRFTRPSGTGFEVTNLQAPDFATYAAQNGATPLAGDFDGDGKTDLALTAGVGWTSVPVARSLGGGSFSVTNSRQDGFAVWATQGSTPVVGDFDDDGRDDIALIGGKNWTTVPVAYATTSGTSFVETNRAAETLAALAAIPGVRPVTRVVRP